MASQICNEPVSDSILKVLTNLVRKKELENIPRVCRLHHTATGIRTTDNMARKESYILI